MRNAPLLLVVTMLSCSHADDWSIVEETTAAGVPHVVNTPPASGIEPTWDIIEEYRIGSVEGGGPASFGNIKAFAVLADERIAVLDAQAQEIRIFGADGKYQRTMGRRGAGPGELADANGFVVGRDGLIRVNDPRNKRLSFFHPDSGFVRSVPADIRSYGYLWDAVIDSADHIWETGYVMTANERFDAVKGYDPQGMWTDTIRQPQAAEADALAGVYSWQRGTSRGFTQVPFFPRPVVVKDPRRGFWVKPPNQNNYRIMRTTFTGDTTLIFESRRPPAPVSQSARDSAIAEIKKTAGEVDWSRIPDTKPIVQQIYVAADGDVWVKVSAADTLTTFDVFGSDGRYKGTAVTPLRVMRYTSPPVVRNGQFWAVVSDELDVAYIVRGRIVPRND
jgi:hypothetical protein